MPASSSMAVPPPPLPLDLVHRATGTAVGAILPVLPPRPQYSRSLSVALRMPAGIPLNTVALPLAVPFLQSVSCTKCLILGVHSTPRLRQSLVGTLAV